MEFHHLYDPALDKHAGELREINARIAAIPARPLDLSTAAGLAQARDLSSIMGGVFARASNEVATTRTIDGPGGPILLRIIEPEGTPTGVYIDLHGGGFFMGEPAMADALNTAIAQAANAVSVSVDYRLAPEHPYPAGPDDCEAAVVWILDNAATEWGVDRFAIGGASAGGNLVAVTLQRLRDRHQRTPFLAANMQFGVYDLSGTPSQIHMGRTAFRDIYLPTTPQAERKVADISPLYATTLTGMPPALFTVGTLDYLYDDSLFMSARWHAAGNETELAVYPAAVHGFTSFDAELARLANQRIVTFIADRLG